MNSGTEDMSESISQMRGPFDLNPDQTLADIVARALHGSKHRSATWPTRSWDDILENQREFWRARACVAILAIADHLDAMGTDTDEESAAVEWIASLLRYGTKSNGNTVLNNSQKSGGV